MQDIRDLVKRHREEATRARARGRMLQPLRIASLPRAAGEWDALADEWTRQLSDGIRAAE